ncbi:Wdsub1 [Symbiodinium sp. CCMP2456]|nr:Wdsub1 [Symbiodinium sp. CCMP2456]
MSKDGVATDTIATWFRLPVSTVVAFLAEPGSIDEDDAGALRCLVRRLLTDPDDFVCPINQDLMRQPVVAEDGFTYEREAIEAALRHRERSPKTNLPMGRKVIPNVLQQASIRVFMERVVEEIFSIAPFLPAVDAQALLVRADSLIRPEPGVPDCKLPTAVRGKLLKVFRLRANLPTSLQGNAQQELKAMLRQTPMRELLDNFNAWDAEPLLSYCCDQKLEWMHLAARRRGSLIHADILERELASRLAHCLPQSLEKLWQFVLSLSSEAPGVWLEGAALVLAAFHGELHVKYRDLPPALLESAIRCLRCREASALRAQSLFKAALGFRFQPDPMSYLAFADRLAASELLEEAADVAILSARAFDALGNKEATQQAYTLAYGWDRNNSEALQGLSAGTAGILGMLFRSERVETFDVNGFRV